MSKRKSCYVAQKFESNTQFLPKHKDGVTHKDTSSNIFNSMRFSQAWHNLSYKQRELYSVLKGLQYAETKRRSELVTEKERATLTNEEISRLNISLRFTFCKSKWCDLYGLYSTNCRKEFSYDMNALIANGFICILQTSRNTWGANIYAYSDKWKQFGKWENPYKSE